MADYSEAYLERLKAAVPISEVIGQYVVWDKAKSRDGDMWSCCPFHNEDSPSFHAVDKDGYYNCFGCDAGGDHFKFLTESQGMAFPDAVAFVAELAGIPLPEEQPVNREPRPPQPKPEPKPKAKTEKKSKTAAREQCKREPVKGYKYTDNDGNELYQVVRYQFKKPDGEWLVDPKTGNLDKTFLQRRKDENGDFVWNLDGIGHTIFRHPQVEIAISEGKTIFIVEGEKDVETLEGFGLTATTNSGGVANWNESHAALFKGADIVLIGDNDEAGREGVQRRGMTLKGVAGRVRVLDLGSCVSGFPEKADITDWRDKFGGDAEKLAALVDQLPDWKPARPKSEMGAMSVAMIEQAPNTHKWLVQDMIELGGTAAFAGFSQAGKSFMMIELAYCVARGVPFWGREVDQGLVIYQAGEGVNGLNKRIKGYMLDRGVEDASKVPFEIIPKKVNLFYSDDDANLLIKEAKMYQEYYDQPLRLIVIDTFNKATRGANEISGQDMGKVIERLERIADECQCTVMVVDHLSAQGRFRGHGSKTGDLTNVIMVETSDQTDRNDRKIRYMRLDKNKDGENGGKIAFVLRQVMVGYDDLNRPITTCVTDEPDGDEEHRDKGGRLSLNQATMLRMLQDVISREGIDPPANANVPSGRKVVKWKVFYEELRKSWIFKAPETEPNKRAVELNRVAADAGKRLMLAGFIGKGKDGDEDIVWWTGKQDRAYPKPKPANDQLPADVNAEVSQAAKDGVPFL